MAITVYYLDDEIALCSIFKECFSSPEINIVTFTDAEEAIAQSLENAPDIIFIDMRLTDTTGDKVALHLDENITKVLITGDLNYQSDYQFEYIMPKPFDIMAIQEFLEQFLAQSK